MTAISARETATRLVAGGYSIVPIKHRDKNPGNLLGGGWTSKTVSADSLATAFPEGVARNIGVLNRDCLVVDIDVYDPSLAERILTETLRRHPGGLVRKGQFPKVAVFYRAGEDFSVRDTGKFFLGHEDESGKKLESEVEFRRGGGQTVAYGVHPCGAVYEWVGPSLADVALCDLPSISQADGEALREWALGELMDAAGVGRPEPKPEGNLGKVYDIRDHQPGGFRFDTGARLSDRERTLDEARELLSFIDPDASYKDWLNVLQALHDEFGDAGLSLADDWSSRGAKYKSGEVETKWRGFTAGGGVTFSTVATMARQGGADLSEISRRHSGAPEAPSLAERPQEAAKRGLTPTPFALRDPARIPPRRWLYGRHLIRGFVSLTVSPGGVGKSSLTLVEALALATGRTLLGDHVIAPATVWAWNGEDPKDEIERRAAAACMHHEIRPDEIGGRLFLDSGRDAPITLAVTEKGETKIARPCVESMVAAIRDKGIDAVFVDPFVTTHLVSENDNGAINAVASLWREIADRTGAAIELVHHAKKGARQFGEDMGADQARGASALVDAVRSARFLTPMSEAEAAQAGLDNPHGYFRVGMGKANLAPPVEKAVWRRLQSVPLGNGSGLYPEGDFVGVVEAWAMPDAFEGMSDRDLETVKQAIAGGDWSASSQAADWVGYAVAEALGLGDIGSPKKDERSPEENRVRARVATMVRAWIKSGELRRVMRRSPRDGRDKPMIETATEAEGKAA